MSEIMQFFEATFKPLVLVFTVANLATVGLRARMPEVVAVVKNMKVLALIFVWGWVLGPALGLLIAWILPLAEPYVICVLIASLAFVRAVPPTGSGKSTRRRELRWRLCSTGCGRHSGFHAVDSASLGQGGDDQRRGSRQTALRDLTRAADNRSGNPALRGDRGNEDPSRGRGIRQARHIAAGRGVLRGLWQCDARHGGQLCLALLHNLHGRKGTDHVSIRFRPETESAQRHVAGYAHAQWCSDVRRYPCHSERGPADPDILPSCGLCGRLQSQPLQPEYSPSRLEKPLEEMQYEYGMNYESFL